MKRIYDGIIKENAIFSLVLGLCSALQVSTNFESAYIMGLCVLVVLLFSNFTISLIKKLIPDNVRIPVFILIIGTFVTILELIIQEYLPGLHTVLGIYLPLIVVNCIVLGRALSVASKKPILDSIKDGLGIGLGYLLSLVIISLIREILGNGTLTIMNQITPLTGYKMVYKIYPDMMILPFSILKEPAGAFITLGLLMAVFKNYISKRSDNDVTN